MPPSARSAAVRAVDVSMLAMETILSGRSDSFCERAPDDAPAAPEQKPMV